MMWKYSVREVALPFAKLLEMSDDAGCQLDCPALAAELHELARQHRWLTLLRNERVVYESFEIAS